MTNFFVSINLYLVILNLVTANDRIEQKSSNIFRFNETLGAAHISPELINELKDFENLIPKSTIDEIIAKHYVFDGNFRTVLKYLRSQEFTQLQKQLLSVPEIIDVLAFLHLTAENATTMHMGATKMPTAGRKVVASLDKFDDDVAAVTNSYKRINKMTTNSAGIVTNTQTIILDANVKKQEALNNLKFPETPQKQFYITQQRTKNVGLEENDIDDEDADDATVNANSIAFSEQQPLVNIVLLEDLEVKAKVSNKEQHQRHHHHPKYKRQCSHCSVGTFISFVEEVLQHLPNSAYQKMITDKCHNNLKFAKFYKALRSPVFKPYIEDIKLKPNIQNIISTLKSHEVDVNTLEAIAFRVISWGPTIPKQK